LKDILEKISELGWRTKHEKAFKKMFSMLLMMNSHYL